MSDVQTAVATKPMHPMIVFRQRLEARADEIKRALPVHISPERFIRAALTAASLNPDILACEFMSVWNALLRACNDGLLPDGIEGAVVPYKSKATWIPMYQGLLKKFRNSGEFKWVTAGLVFDGDEYDHWIDETGEHFRHRPADDHEGKKPRRVYALATTKDGGSFIADMSMADINKRRSMSRASREDAPWKVWPEEMMKKTALRQLSKLLPKSSDLDALMQRDEAALLGVELVEERRGAIAANDSMSALERFAQEDDDERAHSQDQSAPAAAAETADAQKPQAQAAHPVIDLFEAGAEAHKLGIPRSRPPGELRAETRAADLRQWHEGWDSKE